MAIVVNTIQSQLWWAAAHVGEESCVAFPPTVADCNASVTIVFVVPVGGVVAAAFHVEPSLVLEGAFLAIGLPMGFADGAATALRPAFDQAAFVDEDALPTVAEAPVAGALRDAPFAIALRPRGAKRHDLEFAEAFSEHSPLYGEQECAVNA